MTIATSLFDAPAQSPLSEASVWMSGVLIGQVAVGLCVIAVALVGLIMLTGRLPVLRGIGVMIGCFVLLGAPAISSGLMGGASQSLSQEPLPPPTPERVLYQREPLPEATYNPYAGASLRRERD